MIWSGDESVVLWVVQAQLGVSRMRNFSLLYVASKSPFGRTSWASKISCCCKQWYAMLLIPHFGSTINCSQQIMRTANWRHRSLRFAGSSDTHYIKWSSCAEIAVVKPHLLQTRKENTPSGCDSGVCKNMFRVKTRSTPRNLRFEESSEDWTKHETSLNQFLFPSSRIQ